MRIHTALILCCGLTAALVGAGTASRVTGAPPAAGGLCTPAEVPLFSCSIGAKRVSICGSGQRAAYRYGLPGKIELSSTQLTFAEKAFSGGGETQITATNKDYSYTVFDRTVRTSLGEDGRHDPAFGSGLLIRHNGKVVATRPCDEDVPIVARARTMIPAGPYIAH